jgi:hypothetical protein
VKPLDCGAFTPTRRAGVGRDPLVGATSGVVANAEGGLCRRGGGGKEVEIGTEGCREGIKGGGVNGFCG